MAPGYLAVYITAEEVIYVFHCLPEEVPYYLIRPSIPTPHTPWYFMMDYDGYYEVFALCLSESEGVAHYELLKGRKIITASRCLFPAIFKYCPKIRELFDLN